MKRSGSTSRGFLLLAATLLAAWCVAGCSRSSSPLDGEWQDIPPARSAGLPVLARADAETLVVPLLTDKMAMVGSVTVTSDGEEARLVLRCAPGWVFDASQAAVVAFPSQFPLTPGGTPRLNRFPFQSKHVPPVSEFAYDVDLAADGFEAGDSLFVAVHVDASRAAGMGGRPQRQSAWARQWQASDGAADPKAKFWYFVYRLPVAPVPACELTLLWPTGGETLCAGFVYEVQWASSGGCDATVAIELVQDDLVCALELAAPNTGFYEWEGAAPCEGTTATCLLRVRFPESGQSTESEPFTIANCGSGE